MQNDFTIAPRFYDGSLRPLSATETLELWLLQLGLMLLGTYFAVGVLTETPYAWPLLMGPGPFFAVLCVYLGCQLQRRTPHLYALVRFVTLFSVPYAGLALARGHLQEGTEAATWHIGYLPPLLLAGTLVLRLHAWRRLFDGAYEDGMDEGGALLLELFAGVGAWCAVVCGVAWAPQLREWAFAQPSGGRLVPMPAYTVTLLRLMFVPALISAGVGAALYVRRASRGATTAALVFVLGIATIHAVMLAAFANDGWSMASGVLWSLVLLGFAQHIFRRGVGRSSAWADAAPNVF